MSAIETFFLPFLLFLTAFVSIGTLGHWIFQCLFRRVFVENLMTVGISLLIGYTVFAYVILVVSLIVPLTFFSVGLVIFIPLVLRARYVLRTIRNFQIFSLWKKNTPAHKLIAAVIVVAAGFHMISAFVPPYRTDSLAYHIPEIHHIAAGEVLKIGGYGNFLSNTPKLMEVLYASGYVFGGYTVAHLMHFSILISFLFVGYSFIKQMYSKSAALYGILGIFLLYEVMVNATNTYVDAASAAYEGAAILLLLLFFRNRERQYLVISGVLFGTALSIKYLAFFGGILIGVLFLHDWYRMRLGVKKNLEHIGLFGAAALIVSAFWYVKNFVVVGNPLYPFVFSHEGISNTSFEAAVNAVKQYTPRTLTRFLFFPFLHFAQGYYLPVLGAFLLLPFSFLIKKYSGIRLLAWLVLLYFTLWFFFISHQKRFAMLGLVLLMLVAGIVIAWIEERYARFVHSASFLIGLSIIGVLGIYGIAMHKDGYLIKVKRAELAYAAGFSDSSHFYQERGLGPIYSLSEHINAHYNGTAFLNLYSDHPFFLKNGNTFIDPGIYIKGNTDISITNFSSYLKDNDIQYVIAYTDNAREIYFNQPSFKENPADIDYMNMILQHVARIETFLPEIGTKVYENNGRVIYQIL